MSWSIRALLMLAVVALLLGWWGLSRQNAALVAEVPGKEATR